MTICRYLDITSEHRDRKQYPSPFNFQVTCTNKTPTSDPKQIQDGYASSVPYTGEVIYRDLTNVLNTANTQVLSVTAQSVAGSYVGQYFDVVNSLGLLLQRLTVTAYNATTNVITVTPNFDSTAIPTGLTPYYAYFRNGIPLTQFTVIAGSTLSSVVINQALNNPNDYIGLWLQSGEFTPNELWDEPKRITNVIVGTTSTTFSLGASSHYAYENPTFLSAIPTVGSVVYILNIVNNAQPIVYNGTTVGSQVPKCYNLDLCDMLISNSQVVYGHPGGAVSTYPYLYLEIQAESQKTSNILVSNNPHSNKALFKIPTASDMITSFINLRSCTSQTIKFKPNDTFSFRFLRPDGQELRWVTTDTQPPFAPDPTIQLSFTIRFCPVNCTEDV